MALTFPTTTSYVNHGTPASLNNIADGATLAWVRPLTLVNGTRVWFKGSGATIYQSLYLGGSGNFTFQIEGTPDLIKTCNDTPVRVGEWFCLAASHVYGTSIELFSGDVNRPLTVRASASSNNGGARTDDSSGPFHIGHRNDDAQNFQGAIACVCRWNRASLPALALADLEEMRQLTGWLCGLLPPPPRDIAIPAGNVLFSLLGAHTLATPDYSPFNNVGLATGVSTFGPMPVNVAPPWLPGLTQVASC